MNLDDDETINHNNNLLIDLMMFADVHGRFVLFDVDGSEATRLAYDGDVRVSWRRVHQVGMPTVAPFTCPICLTTPPALASMARCGHVFCRPCLLRYFATSLTTPVTLTSTLTSSSHAMTSSSLSSLPSPSSQSRPCPVCYVRLCVDDLRDVLPIHVRDVTPLFARPSNAPVSLTLVQRATAATTVMPRRLFVPYACSSLPLLTTTTSHASTTSNNHSKSSSNNPSNNASKSLSLSPCPWNDDALRFCKYVVADVDLVHRHYIYTLNHIAEKLAQLAPIAASSTADPHVQQSAKINPLPSLPPVEYSEEQWECATWQWCQQHVTTLLEQLRPLSTTHLAITNATAVASNDPSDYFFFYQASDGQLLFLNNLDVRILKLQYANYHAFPDAISIHVAFIETVVVDEDFRKRNKYLSHLPMSSSLHVVDVDWSLKNVAVADDGTKTALVSPDTLEKFSQDLQARKKRRDKTRRERRHHKNGRHNKNATTPSLKADHEAILKELQQHNMTPLPSEPTMWDLDDMSAWPSSSQHPPRSPPAHDDPNNGPLSSSLPSYAQIANIGKSPSQGLLSLSNPDEWPSVGPTSTSQSSTGGAPPLSQSPGTFSFAKVLEQSRSKVPSTNKRY